MGKIIKLITAAVLAAAMFGGSPAAAYDCSSFSDPHGCQAEPPGYYDVCECDTDLCFTASKWSGMGETPCDALCDNHGPSYPSSTCLWFWPGDDDFKSFSWNCDCETV